MVTVLFNWYQQAGRDQTTSSRAKPGTAVPDQRRTSLQDRDGRRTHPVETADGRYDEPPRRYEEPQRRHEEPSRRHEEPSRRSEEPSRRYEETPRRSEEPSRRHEEPPGRSEEPSGTHADRDVAQGSAGRSTRDKQRPRTDRSRRFN